MKVGIGNDHAAVELNMQIKEFIESMGHDLPSLILKPRSVARDINSWFRART